MKIIEITDTMQKQAITRQILEALPEWFGIAEAREEYINESIKYPFFSAFDEDIPIGFVYLKQTGTSTIELAAMGVLRKYHHQGVGTDLIAVAKEYAYKQKYLFLQVKTVKMGCYELYDQTNRFYLAQGFHEFEVFPTLWDTHNPCQVYVMALRQFIHCIKTILLSNLDKYKKTLKLIYSLSVYFLNGGSTRN